MVKAHGTAVQRLSGNQLRTAAVEVIPEQRMSEVAHMTADLVSSSRFQPQPQQRDAHPFSAYAHDWYNRFKEPSLGASTKVTQKGWLKSLCKHFDDKALEDFTVDDIQDYLNSMQHLKKPTIDQRKTFLGEILDAACEDGIIKKNPAKSRRLTNPGKESDGISSMLRDDYRRLLEKLSTMEDARIQLMLSLMAYTGLRREEVLGLMWEDIDFETGFLHVQRAVIIPNAKMIFTSSPLASII